MRDTRLQRVLGVMTTALLVVIGGCGGPPSAESSTTEATVSGTITIKGKPATKGRIVFDPSNINRKMEAPREAEISPDGTYTIKTLIGDNAVGVSTPELNRDRQLGGQTYTFNVQPGENKIDIVIPPPGAAPPPEAAPSTSGR